MPRRGRTSRSFTWGAWGTSRSASARRARTECLEQGRVCGWICSELTRLNRQGWCIGIVPVAFGIAMARFVFLLLTVGLTACSVPPAAAPVANAAQIAHAPGVGGALPTSGSGRPEPVTLWQDADIFHLGARLIESARTRRMVER